jgi:hypothetical protein
MKTTALILAAMLAVPSISIAQQSGQPTVVAQAEGAGAAGGSGAGAGAAAAGGAAVGGVAVGTLAAIAALAAIALAVAAANDDDTVVATSTNTR